MTVSTRWHDARFAVVPFFFCENRVISLSFLQGDVARFLYNVEWKPKLKDEWLEYTRTLVINSLTDIKSVNIEPETQPLPDLVWLEEYERAADQRILKTKELLELLVEKAFCKRLAEQFYYNGNCKDCTPFNNKFSHPVREMNLLVLKYDTREFILVFLFIASSEYRRSIERIFGDELGQNDRKDKIGGYI